MIEAAEEKRQLFRKRLDRAKMDGYKDNRSVI